MSHGRSVRMFLAEGVSSGLRHAEIVNWTGQAVACPRSRVKELSGWVEVQRPGVYFLLAPERSGESAKVYIGEAENVLVRLGEHLKKKGFWNEVVFFTSKDENLTKSHVKYLESRLIGLTELAGRYKLENGNGSQLPTLPRGDKSAMEEYINNVKILLGTLGHRLLEPILASLPATSSTSSLQDAEREQLVFKGRTFLAHGQQTDEGFVVLKGSTLSSELANTTPHTVRVIHEDGLKNGMIESTDKPETLLLTSTALFTSSSYAACFVAGSNRNGRSSWKTKDGQSLGELEDLSIEALSDYSDLQRSETP